MSWTHYAKRPSGLCTSQLNDLTLPLLYTFLFSQTVLKIDAFDIWLSKSIYYLYTSLECPLLIYHTFCLIIDYNTLINIDVEEVRNSSFHERRDRNAIWFKLSSFLFPKRWFGKSKRKGGEGTKGVVFLDCCS